MTQSLLLKQPLVRCLSKVRQRTTRGDPLIVEPFDFVSPPATLGSATCQDGVDIEDKAKLRILSSAAECLERAQDMAT